MFCCNKDFGNSEWELVTLTPEGFDAKMGELSANSMIFTTNYCPDGNKIQKAKFNSTSNAAAACGEKICSCDCAITIIHAYLSCALNICLQII